MMMKPDPQPPDAFARVSASRFGLVLLLLFVTFVFMASAPSGGWVRVVAVALEGMTLVAALFASDARTRLIRIATIVVIVSLVSSITSLFFTSVDGGNGAFFALNALLVAAAPIVIGRAMWRRRVVDLHTVLAAICIYVLIGMLAAFAFSAMGDLGSVSFFAQMKHATIADYLYYSFATITTVGYGDLTAAGGLGRACSVLEALMGQLYLVTVVALLVSNLSHSRSSSAP